MSTGLLPIVKQAALDAMDNAKMCDLRYGKVVSTSPLKIQITNQFTLPQSLLIVPEHLKDRNVKVSLDVSLPSYTHSHEVKLKENDVEIKDMETDVASDTHTHTIPSPLTITIHNALKVGDKVALLREQGGQSYFILDRI